MTNFEITKIAEQAIREGVRIALETPQIVSEDGKRNKTADIIEDKIQTYLYDLLAKLDKK